MPDGLDIDISLEDLAGLAEQLINYDLRGAATSLLGVLTAATTSSPALGSIVKAGGDALARGLANTADRRLKEAEEAYDTAEARKKALSEQLAAVVRSTLRSDAQPLLEKLRGCLAEVDAALRQQRIEGVFAHADQQRGFDAVLAELRKPSRPTADDRRYDRERHGPRPGGNRELACYRKAALGRYSHINLAGFKTHLRVPIALDELYVPLNAMVDLRAVGTAEFETDEDAEEKP